LQHLAIMRLWQFLAFLCAVLGALAIGFAAASQGVAGKLYRVVDGKVDAQTYNGYRRYHAGCNHCHGPDGIGSSFGPSLIETSTDIELFRRVVREGKRDGNLVMNGFSDDPNVAPYIDDIYSYLQGRADGAIPRGRPAKIQE
jgi:mono/diheme cytochrome c family protein